MISATTTSPVFGRCRHQHEASPDEPICHGPLELASTGVPRSWTGRSFQRKGTRRARSGPNEGQTHARYLNGFVLRKTVATRLDEAGLSARQIADHLSHNRPSLTQDVYLGRGLASLEARAALQRLR